MHADRNEVLTAMMPLRNRSPKVKAFVRAPFIRCPDCGAPDTFGVLMICDRHYIRRCVGCWFDQRLPLPPIEKKVIYLDQFVISNMMKELDPDRPAAAKGIKGGFYRTLFERLDRLSKLQLVVCPDSPVQDNESVVDSRYEKLRSVFRHLSHGVGLHPPEALFHRQLLRAFRKWVQPDTSEPLAERDDAFTSKRNVWLERFRIELNYKLPGLAESLRNINTKRTQHLRDVCVHWQNAPDFDFNDVFEGELGAIVQGPWLEYLAYAARLLATQQGEIQVDLDRLYPPESSAMISHMLGDIRRGAADSAEAFARIHEFFGSTAARSIPYARVSALFWAGIAREVRAGRSEETFPRAGMINDIDLVAAYAPFCDALFVDKQISHLAAQPELKRELAGSGQLFSLRDGEDQEFLSYLDQIEAGASAAHLDAVASVYGSDWPKPYVELLAHKP